MVIVLGEQICLLLVEEIEPGLRVAKKDVLGVDDDFVTCHLIFDPSINRALSTQLILEWNQYLVEIVCIDHRL